MQCSSFVVLAYDITHSDCLAGTASNAGRIDCRAIAARELLAKRVEIADEQSKSCIRPPAWLKTRLRLCLDGTINAWTRAPNPSRRFSMERSELNACGWLSNQILPSLLPELNEVGRSLGRMLAIIWSSSSLPQRLCGEERSSSPAISR